MEKKRMIEKMYDVIFRARTRKEEWDIWHKRTLLEIKRIKKLNRLPREISDATEIKYYSWLSDEILAITGGKFKNILEVGGGSGAFSFFLSKKNGADCTVLDNSETALNYASIVFKDWKANFVKGDGMNLPFNEESFDFIHSIGLIEHYEDSNIARIVSEMKRVLKKGGFIILAVPNYFSPDLILLWAKYRKGSERFISVKSLKKYITSIGLQVIKVGHSNFTFDYRIGKLLPIELEKIIGHCGFGFLNYIVSKK
ncbi:MAG: class I SAM-dependent methyltransferase [Patescibacteria group bacterium]